MIPSDTKEQAKQSTAKQRKTKQKQSKAKQRKTKQNKSKAKVKPSKEKQSKIKAKATSLNPPISIHSWDSFFEPFSDCRVFHLKIFLLKQIC